MLSLLSALALAQTAFTPKPYAHRVMIWVPPYAVAASQTALNTPGVADAVTHLALQFWVPTTDGLAALDAKEQEVTDKAVTDLRDWGHAHGIRVMLTVFNGEDKWDWPLAKTGFDTNQDKFVASLMDQVSKYGLDGVDIDLEGPGDFEPDKPAYVAFIQKLGQALHAQQKQLTLDSFCYKWNAPNQGWWPDLFPNVDAITSMGYQDTGLGAKDWAAYSAQEAAAGTFAGKLQIGVPSHRDTWQGNKAAEQLEWIRKDGHCGVGIWDAQLRATSWKTDSVWGVLERLSSGKGS